MNIYEAKQLVIDSEKLVISKKEFSNLIGKSLPVARVYANRLKNKNLLKIIRGKLVFTEDEFIVASQLIEPSYISLHSALYYNNLIKQVPKKIQCVTPINTIKEGKFLYHKMNPKLFFGFKKIRVNGSWLFVAKPEKAIIDGIYLKRISEDLVKELIPELNKKTLRLFISELKKSKVKKTKRVLSFFEDVLK